MENGSERYIEALRVCGRLYDFINGELFKGELIKPVITIAPDVRNKATGWFVPKEVWKESGGDKG